MTNSPYYFVQLVLDFFGALLSLSSPSSVANHPNVRSIDRELDRIAGEDLEHMSELADRIFEFDRSIDRKRP